MSEHSILDEGIDALKRDLLSPGGPQISPIRNYNFAILWYPPAEEFDLRYKIGKLSDDLQDEGWLVRSIPLHQLLFQRIRRLGSDYLSSLIAREKRLFPKSNGMERALALVKEKLEGEIEGPNGLAADVARVIDEFCRAHPDHLDRIVVFIGRAGALYPFYRTSSLLKHIDGRTEHKVPIILLYPGKREGQNGLKFMGIQEADRDYRPRIYP